VIGDAIWNVAVVPWGALGLETTNDPQLLTDCPSQLLVPSQVAVCVIDWPGNSSSVVAVWACALLMEDHTAVPPWVIPKLGGSTLTETADMEGLVSVKVNWIGSPTW
jgi:hypothetical protein